MGKRANGPCARVARDHEYSISHAATNVFTSSRAETRNPLLLLLLCSPRLERFRFLRLSSYVYSFTSTAPRIAVMLVSILILVSYLFTPISAVPTQSHFEAPSKLLSRNVTDYAEHLRVKYGVPGVGIALAATSKYTGGCDVTETLTFGTADGRGRPLTEDVGGPKLVSC